MKVTEISAPPVEGRERRPQVMFPYGDDVVVVHYLVLEPGEDIDDTPPEDHMTRAEWKQRHTDYGLTIDGRPLEEPSP